MPAERVIYICENCFKASDAEGECCGHAMIRCETGEPGSERSRPLYAEDGRLRSHAPRWWLERHQRGQASNTTPQN